MTNFQIAVIGIFIFLTIFGVLVFAGVIPGFRPGPGGDMGQVIWWGTVPQRQINGELATFRDANQGRFVLTYVEKDPRTIETELIDALASGKGPDLVSWPSDLLIKQADKLQFLPYESISRRQFQDTFIQESQLLLMPAGALGVPLYVDPLVMYFNTDLLANSRLATPPRTWTQLRDRISVLSNIDPQKNIVQSAIPLGGYSNIVNAKDILVTLMMQAGNPIVSRRGEGGLQVTLRNEIAQSKHPAVDALSFYQQFSNPASQFYSWNSARPEAQAAFLRGESVLYLGFASELEGMRRKNPQINFDVTILPQLEGSTRELTFGRLTSLVVPAQSRNPAGAWYVAWALATSDFAEALSKKIALAPVRLDLLQNGHQDPFMDVFYQSAIIARGWLDPDPTATAQIFKAMVDTVASGRLLVTEAVSNAHDQIQIILSK